MLEGRVADRYETLEIIGRGGEATVLKAIDTRHQRLVALKVRTLPPGESSEDLLAEARVLLSLPAHPGLAHARDDVLEDGRHLIVLDWVEGVNLARLLADEGRPGLPASSVLRWIAQAAEALTMLHHHGLVHGDVKPANLILDGSGRIVVVDLGSSSVPMRAGPRGGTPGYRAPEVAAGSPADQRSDVFSLAATTFTLLTGQLPTGERPTWKGLTPQVAERFERALRNGLSIDPERRPATPGLLVEQLRAGWQDRTPSGVVTALLTDVVDSSTLWERSPGSVPGLLAEMQLVIDRAVERHGGQRVGSTVEGDSTMSVFPNAVHAVEAAIELQRELMSRPDGLRVRAGAATGELLQVEGDLFGPTLSRAARVRELAKAGEILLAATTADIVRAAALPGVELLALGPHALRGLEGVDDVAAVIADGVAAPPDPARSPYPGLAAFGLDDADLFFGREDVVEQCLGLLRGAGFVAIVGASGSGKTSVALAGVAPRLGDVVIVRPGPEPARSMDAAGLADRQEAVLVVDQLEELVILCRAPEQRTAFVDAMLGHPGGLVVTVRADLYGEFGSFPELARQLASSQVLLGPLGTPDLIRAVNEPAQRCGLVIEEGLAEVISAELGDAPGALPLLGHALREAWLRREGRTITLAGYRASGGVRSAIGATADRALAALDDSGRTVARQILLRMVELRSDGDDARRWVGRDELVDLDPATAQDVLRALVTSRLLVADGDQVTLVHEALLRAWPRLGEWIIEERASLLARQELRWAAERWALGGRSEGDLYRGLRLDAALELATQEHLGGHEESFVEASRAQRARDQAEARRRTRRLRVLATVSSVLAVVALAVGAIAVVQRNEARDAREVADASAIEADDAAAAAEEAAAAADGERAAADAAARSAQIEALVGRVESLRVTQRDAAALLALEAFRLEDNARTRSALLSTFTQDDGFLDAHRYDSELGGSGIMTPDDSAYVVDPSGRLRAYDLETGDRGEPFPRLFDGATAFAALDVTRDGDAIAQVAFGFLARASATLGVFDTSTRALRFAPVTLDSVNGVAFTPDGKHLAISLGEDGRLLVLDAMTGSAVADVPGIPDPPGDFTLPRLALVGADLVIASGDSSLRVFDGTTFELRRTIPAPRDQLIVIRDAGDGTAIIAGLQTVARIDIGAGEERWRHPTPGTCTQVTVVPSRGTLYCGDSFGRLEERDLSTGLVLRELDAQNGNSGELYPARQGTELVSFSDNEPVVSRWRLDGSGPITRVIAPGWNAFLFSPDGTKLTVERGVFPAAHESQVVDVETGRVVRDLEGVAVPNWLDDDTIRGATINGEGALELVHVELAGGPVVSDGIFPGPVPAEALGESTKSKVLLRYEDGADAEIAVFDPATAAIGPKVRVENFLSMAISRNGDRFATGGADGVVVYDGLTGQEVGAIPGSTRSGVFITPADQLFVSSIGGELTQYDLDTLEPIRTFGGSRGYVQRVFGSLDGSIIVTNGGDRSVTLFDVASGVRLGAPITVADDALNNIALSPDGKRLAVNSSEGVQIWDLEPSHWTDTACRVAGRNLTREEWDTNIGDLAPYRASCPDLPFAG
jgi:class 3 adenylate cyclase/WD40 repeat protein